LSRPDAKPSAIGLAQMAEARRRTHAVEQKTSLPEAQRRMSAQKGFDKIYEYLEALYATIIEKDITQRYKIYDKRAFGNVTKFVAANMGSPISPSRNHS
jgi:hypothetical protein